MIRSSTIDQHIGFSQGFHDAGIGIVSSSGDISFAAHSERYSKRKNDPRLSKEMLDKLRRQNAFLGKASINYYERNWLTNLRRLYAGQDLKSMRDFKATLRNSLLPDTYKSWGHHLSHAALAFQTSPFDRSAIVVVDAIGELDTVSIWSAWHDDQGKARYQRHWTKHYPHSIGLFYSAMTKRIGLKPMEDEYILMGMAAYGKHDKLLQKFLRDDFIADVENVRFKQNLHLGCDDWMPMIKDEAIAANVQSLTEEMLWEIHRRAHSITQETNVCYGGGVALNCAFNTWLPQIWGKVWIPPNPGDCGSALGAAALSYGKKLRWEDAFLGENIPGELDVSAVIDKLLTDGIVGVANGRAEWGPRALGNRSLLADPRRPGINNKVNEIKQRQKYRPFAPAVLSEHADEWFSLNKSCDYSYMQYVVPATKASQLKPICHVDGTSRVQSVQKGNLRKILEAWYSRTGCPILLNTSLNIKGQPIVNDRIDADIFQKEYGVQVIS